MWDPFSHISQPLNQPGALGAYGPTQSNPGVRAGRPDQDRGGGGLGGMFNPRRMGRFGEFGDMFAMPEMAAMGSDPRAFKQAMKGWGKEAPFGMRDFRQAYQGWQGAGSPALAAYQPVLDMQTQWNDWLATRPTGSF